MPSKVSPVRTSCTDGPKVWAVQEKHCHAMLFVWTAPYAAASTNQNSISIMCCTVLLIFFINRRPKNGCESRKCLILFNLCFQRLLKNAADCCPYRAADSARCMRLCAHSTCRSTMPLPACEMSANDSEETMAIKLYKFNVLQTSCLESDA